MFSFLDYLFYFIILNCRLVLAHNTSISLKSRQVAIFEINVVMIFMSGVGCQVSVNPELTNRISASLACEIISGHVCTIFYRSLSVCII